jgi:biopolymer transport protein ExbD
MKMSRRALRMERRHQRRGGSAAFNLVSLMDIFTILVFFLLVNSSDGEVLPSTRSVSLPESVAEDKPRENVVVMVTGRDILVQGRKVASVAQAMAGPDVLLPELRLALEAQAERAVVRPRAADNREVTIMGDKAIPFRLLKKVMATCTEAGYGRISLAVLQKASQEI